MATPNKVMPYIRPLANGVLNPSGRLPNIGEMIFVKVPYKFTEDDALVTNLSKDDRQLYPLIITETNADMSGNKMTWKVKGLPCRSFRTLGSNQAAIEHVQNLHPELRRMLLPLPSVDKAPTPPEFGSPLEISDYINQKPRWVLAYEIPVDLGESGKVSPTSPSSSILNTDSFGLV